MSKYKTYSELIALPTFEERLEYLRLYGDVGRETFGFERYLNQALYHSKEWELTKTKVIARDMGFDLAHSDHPIGGRLIIVHHMNPITANDIRGHSDLIFNPEYLISTILDTHNIIHYGIVRPQIPDGNRTPGDTTLWG